MQKTEKKKYVYLFYAKNGDWNDIYSCTTEIETMKKYKLSFCPGTQQWMYFKHYMEYEGYLQTVETIRIAKQEFEDLGGVPPYISVDEYFSQSTKEARMLKNKLGW